MLLHKCDASLVEFDIFKLVSRQCVKGCEDFRVGKLCMNGNSCAFTFVQKVYNMVVSKKKNPYVVMKKKLYRVVISAVMP